MGTVSSAFLRFVVDAARQRGLDVQAIFGALGVDSSALEQPDRRFPGELFARAWVEAERLSGDPMFGLHAGERMMGGAFELVDYMVMAAPDLGSALDRLARYYRLMNDFVHVSAERNDQTLRLLHSGPGTSFESMHHAWDAFAAVIVVRTRAALGPDWAPRSFASMHPPPLDLSEHERLFRAPLTFGGPVNEVVFDSRDASRPFPSTDPSLSRVLTHWADELLTRLPDTSDVATQVRRVLRERLRGCEVTLEEVAAQLHLSTRSLQRKLSEAGTGFHELLDEERHRQAMQYLDSGRIAISEIAFLLGYAQPHAFHRAFRRWTGMTPAAYRENNKRTS